MEWLLADPGTWKDLGWLAVNAVAGTVMLLAPIALIVGGAAALFELNLHGGGRDAFNGFDRGLGAVLAALGVAAAPWMLRAYGGLARLVLAPSEHSVLEQRVEYLALTRQESLDTGAAELRRIERDLHDGAQARLVAMGLTLDAAGRLIDTDPAAARSLLIEARDASAKALAELRDLVRGVHPPVLADRGLAEAVRALALDSPVRASVTGSLDGRPPARSNRPPTSRSASCSPTWPSTPAPESADIDLRHSLGALRISVRDDGDGGADPGGAPACAASSGGSRPSTASSRSAARPAARPRSRWRSRASCRSPATGRRRARAQPADEAEPCTSSSPRTSSCSATG